MSDDGPGGELAIAPERLSELMASGQDPQVIDVREPHEREAGYIEGSRHIELTRLSGAADAVDRERPVYFYCRVGARSAMAAEAFRTAGYEAYSLDGGLVRWAEEGRPLSPEGGVVAAH
jgi:rhodanese-related sulfurtransferase